MTGGNTEAGRAYLRARNLSEQLDDAPELLRALVGLFNVHQVRADVASEGEVAEEMLRLAGRLQDPESRLIGHMWTGVACYYQGEFSRAREHLEEAIGCYDPRQYRAHAYHYSRSDPGINALGYASWTLGYLGQPDQALARSREALALAPQLAHPYSQANALLFAGPLHLARREWEAALEVDEALITFSREHGFQTHVGVATFFRACALAHLGRLPEGIAGMRAVLEAMRERGFAATRTALLMLLAEPLGKARQAEEGLALTREAQELMAKTGERFFEAGVYRVKGDLLLSLPTPDPAQAEAAFREALEVARRQGGKSFELRAATSLARLWHGQGRPDEARALLQPVYDWFTEGFDTQDLKDAKALLGKLG